jgi:hypothetical protein
VRPLRVGILGAARITELSLIGPARETGDRLVAVAARDRARAESFAAQHGVERVAASYAELLADPEVEVVYNPLANALHGPWNRAAVEAGKHVLTKAPDRAQRGSAVSGSRRWARGRRTPTSSRRWPLTCATARRCSRTRTTPSRTWG